MRTTFNFKLLGIATLMSLMICKPTLIQAQESQKNILSADFKFESIKPTILEPAEWSPVPMPGSEWDQLPEDLKLEYMNAGEASLEAEFATLPATLLMDFNNTGNRSRFQAAYSAKRTHLANLVMAECLEREGRFLDQIANGIWSIAEETWWAIPAHYNQYGQQALPDVSVQYVDLFSAETGILFAWTYYLLGDELDKLSPELNKRILYEVKRRILDPCLEEKDMHWMGYQGQSLNNWTPWICSNWITCSLLCEQNPHRRDLTIYKNLDIIDRFLEPYNPDGGCDEGPGYWTRAGASLFDCLELLELASGGEIAAWDHPLVQNIGKYIYKVHIKDSYYVNFADASGLVHPDPTLIYRYGEKIGDPQMTAFAAWLLQKDGADFLLKERMGRSLPGIFSLKALSQEAPEISYENSWFPDLEVMVARESGKEGDGLYLAAKGGFNAESHNHNDVGSFIVYFNGQPVLIDVGVETYTKKTFSQERYDIWTMQSQYHNLPTINGEMQSPGLSFTASDVKYSSNSKRDEMSLNLAGAYPEAAGVKEWTRSLVLDKSGAQVKVTDHYELKEAKEPLILNLMSHTQPTVDEKNRSILIQVADAAGSKVQISYPKGFSAKVESCPTEDPRLASVWGEQIYRIQLVADKALKSGSCGIVIKKSN